MDDDQAAAELGAPGRSPFHQRLRQVIGSERPYPWADRAGIPRSTFRRIWRGDLLPKAEHLISIRSATGASIDWLLTGSSESEGSKEVADVPPSFHNLALIPRLDVRASAGPGAALAFSETVLSHIAVPADWVRRTFGLPPEELAVIEAIGDSMQPTINPGEPLLVHTNISDVRPDGIYVIDVGGSLNLKRLQILPGGGLRVSSDNKNYPEQILSPEEASFVTVHARALTAFKRLS